MTDFFSSSQAAPLSSPLAVAPKSLMARVEDALLPLINLVFLLLMFFIVAGQLQNRALPPLPGTSAEQVSDRAQADLVVLASGDWQIDGRTVTTDSITRQLPAPKTTPSLTVAAAAGTTMADLESLLSLLAGAGYRDVILLTEPSGA